MILARLIVTLDGLGYAIWLGNMLFYLRDVLTFACSFFLRFLVEKRAMHDSSIWKSLHCCHLCIRHDWVQSSLLHVPTHPELPILSALGIEQEPTPQKVVGFTLLLFRTKPAKELYS